MYYERLALSRFEGRAKRQAKVTIRGEQSKGGGIQKEKGKAPERVSTQGLF